MAVGMLTDELHSQGLLLCSKWQYMSPANRESGQEKLKASPHDIRHPKLN